MLKNFVSVKDVAHIDNLVQQARSYKENPRRRCTLGVGKRLGLLFLNPSLRTRLSTQIAASNLGMESIVFNVDKEGWKMEFADGVTMNGDSVEHIKDAAPILGKYFDVLAIRTFPGLQDREADYSEQLINDLQRYARIPVVSLESATLHPLQSLADIITMEEHMASSCMQHKPKVVLTWAPHVKALPQCVANSFAQWVNAWGKADFVIANPEGYNLAPEFVQNATMEHNQDAALKDADFVYVKNWSSYEQYGQVLPTGTPDWMLTPEKLQSTRQARVMHCLPVRRNVELSEAVLDGPHSLVTEQGANRVWSAQAVLAAILENSF